MSGDFFSQLRRLVGIKQEVEQLQESILHQGRQQRDDPPESSAFLLLKQLQTDLKTLKVDAHKKLLSLNDDGGFMAVIPLCQAILQHQTKLILDVEMHLSKYGYTPLETPPDEGESMAPETPCPPPGTPGQNQQQQQQQTRDVAVVSATPKTKPEFDLDRTPTLEDFGLSEDHLASVVKRNDLVFKEPPPYAVYCKANMLVDQTSPPMTKWPSAESIPENFCNPVGIAITPGLFDGRALPTVTPGMHVGGATTRFHQNDFATPEAATPRQRLLLSLRLAGGDGDEGDDGDPGRPGAPPTSPGITPRLAPGARQPPAPGPEDEESPVPPVLSTPGVKQLYRPAPGAFTPGAPGESSTDTSPAQPVFNTPALNKQMRRAAMTSCQEDTSSSDNTPEPPQLCTPNLMDRFRTKLSKPASPAHSALGSAAPTPELSQLTQCPRSTKAHFLQEGDDDMPATPEMTFNLKSLAKYLHPVTPQASKAAPQTSCTGDPAATASSVPKPMQSSYESTTVDEGDLPQEPELTSNFLRITANQAPAPSPAAPPALTERPRQCLKATTKADTGGIIVKPTAALPPGFPRVSAITCEEYVAQPNWVQRQLSFDMIGEAIDKINTVLVQKAKEGKALTLHKRDVGTLTLGYVLLNTKRIMAQHTSNLGTTYTVLQRH